MSKDLNQLFDELLNQYINTIESNCLNQLKQAKNKTFVLESLLNQIRGMIRFYSLTFTKHNKAFNYFIEKYNRGETIEKIINKIKTDYPEAMKMAPEINDQENIELIPFGKEEELLLKEFPKEMQDIISFHAGYLALNEITKRIPGYLNHSEKNNTGLLASKYPIQWRVPKDTKNEFVQLIYGLHQAGFINEGKGEIIKITETLAEAFGLDLGRNWQSNHSASIHKAKTNYQPPVFDKIKEAYLKYAQSLAEEKNKKK